MSLDRSAQRLGTTRCDLDRSTGDHGRHGGHCLEGDLQLASEGATERSCDHAHLVARKIKDPGQLLTRLERSLRRRVDGGDSVDHHGQAYQWFEIGVVLALGLEAALHDVGRCGEGRGDVSDVVLKFLADLPLHRR